MKIKSTKLLISISTLVLAACNAGATPAPTIDINAISTAALGTALAQVSSQQTQTALAAPSPTPLPTNTPLPQPTAALPTTAGALPTNAVAIPTLSFNITPNTTPLTGVTPIAGAPAAPAASSGNVCNSLTYVSDVNYPDGTVFDGGEDFEKTWQVQNSGTCTWDEGYELVFVDGDEAMDPVDVQIKDSVSPGQTVELSVDLTAPLAFGTYNGVWQMRSDSGELFGTQVTVNFKVK